MLRMFMFLSVGVALFSAFALYAISHQTKLLADANQSTEREIRKLGRDIAVLRAERSYLMRPDRIEPLARKLGMRPARGDQFITPKELYSKQRRR